MVMSIISAVASCVQLSLAVAAAAWDVYDLDLYGCYYYVGPYRPRDAVHVRCSARFCLFTFRIFAVVFSFLITQLKCL